LTNKLYKTNPNAENGIESVKKKAPEARGEDLTA
jgi:uncharacterized protein YegP (UPF0339 family)